jgi:hypothetical protein
MKHKCPICGVPADSETGDDFPFCSERCRVLDLGNWASGKYVISSPAFDEDFDEVPSEAPPAGEDSQSQQSPKPAEDDQND